jgi:hypothetical protein
MLHEQSPPPLPYGARVASRTALYQGTVEYGGHVVSVGDDILDSQSLVDKLYTFYLALLGGRWVGTPGLPSEIGDVGHAYLQGFYYPCVRRPVLAGEVDLRADGLPRYAGLIQTLGQADSSAEDGLYFMTARPSPVPRGIAVPCRGEHYRFAAMWRPTRPRRSPRREKVDTLEVAAWPFVVRPDGRLWAAKWIGDTRTGPGLDAFMSLALDASVVLNAWADRRYLWQVETSENLMGSGHRTPLVLGVGVEHVKSLFYAREAPLTDTGRKRPILHWVRAHERRLREGIEVDVREHLRGIVGFEMAGFPFRIISPFKTGHDARSR